MWRRSATKPIGNPLEGHKGSVTSVAFNPDGQTLACAGEDEIIQLWPIELAREVGWIGYTCHHLPGYLSVRRKTDAVVREAWRAYKRSDFWKKEQRKEKETIL